MKRVLGLAWLTAVLCCPACSEDEIIVHRGAKATKTPTPAAAAQTPKDTATTASMQALLLRLERDPFEVFAELLGQNTLEVPQRAVIMPNTALDEMRLIAVVTGQVRARAMIVDRSGVGFVVERGDYLGRPDRLRPSAAGVTIAIHWRVERIYASEIVLTRASPGQAATAKMQRRTLALREALDSEIAMQGALAEGNEGTSTPASP